MPLPRDKVVGRKNKDVAGEGLYRELKENVEQLDTPMTRGAWISYIQQYLKVDKKYAKTLYEKLRDNQVLSVISFIQSNPVLIPSRAPIWSHNKKVIDNPNYF